MVIPIEIGALDHSKCKTVRLVKGWEDLEIRGQVETIQNSEMNPEDLKRLSITQTPEKNHQLVSKTLK